MMHDSWGWGMGWGAWIIPIAVILIVVFFWEEDAKGEISEGQYQLDIAPLFENEPDRVMQLASIIILG